MHVLLTGGTGFIGSHTVEALVARRHDVRLLVRDADRAGAALARRGVAPGDVDVVVGDVLDGDAVRAAVDGCDTVVHAAAAIGVTTGASVSEQNVDGARTVVDAALDAGCGRIVHVSTVAVFLPPSQPVITVDSPLASPASEYGRSKVEAERWMRERQDDGAPITVVYPGGVIGPDQPRLDSAMEGIAAGRRIAWPLAPGGIAIVDVRDVAAALLAAVEADRVPPRLLLGGSFVTWSELADLTDEACGTTVPRIPVPRPLLTGAGAALDVLRRFVPLGYPLTREAAEIMTSMVPTDDGPTLAALGVEPRPVRESLEDALRWLVAAGHLPASKAPRLAA